MTRLGACRLPLLAAAVLAAAGCAPRSGPREYAIHVTKDGFVPRTLVVARGRPARIVITRLTDKTCATEMVFEGMDLKRDLPLYQAVRIDLPAGAGDTLRYACGMDMYHGMIVAK